MAAWDAQSGLQAQLQGNFSQLSPYGSGVKTETIHYMKFPIPLGARTACGVVAVLDGLLRSMAAAEDIAKVTCVDCMRALLREKL